MLRPSQPVGIIARKQLSPRCPSASVSWPRLGSHFSLDPAAAARSPAGRSPPRPSRSAPRRSMPPTSAIRLPPLDRQPVHPFRPGPRLAEPAPGHHQPHPPAVARPAAAGHCGPRTRTSRRSSALRATASGDSRALFFGGSFCSSRHSSRVSILSRGRRVASSPLSSRSRFLPSFARILSRTSSASSSDSMLSMDAAVSPCRLSSAIASWFGYSRMCSLAATGGRHALHHSVHRPVEKHELELRITLRDRPRPSGPESGVQLALAIRPIGGEPRRLRRPHDVARIGERREKGLDLLVRNVLLAPRAPLRARFPVQRELALILHHRNPPRHLRFDPTKSFVPAKAGAQTNKRPVTPKGARPETQFFTVPTVYLNSVTMSRHFSPIWFFVEYESPCGFCRVEQSELIGLG